jgi:hypothetical protein
MKLQQAKGLILDGMMMMMMITPIWRMRKFVRWDGNQYYLI